MSKAKRTFTHAEGSIVTVNGTIRRNKASEPVLFVRAFDFTDVSSERMIELAATGLFIEEQAHKRANWDTVQLEVTEPIMVAMMAKRTRKQGKRDPKKTAARSVNNMTPTERETFIREQAKLLGITL